jgi:hypothetical protein
MSETARFASYPGRTSSVGWMRLKGSRIVIDEECLRQRDTWRRDVYATSTASYILRSLR